VFGSLLTWLNDHESDVFFVGTCNDASKLPPEFARAERFDGVFFVDLPGRDQKDQIWGIDIRHYGLDAKQVRPGRRQLDRRRDQVVLQAGVALGRAARSGCAERGPGGCHCGRQDRVAQAVGLWSVPVG
jgi:SpoVK/Ycf46/Vps4 family AAA+-type ATPase